MPFTRYLRCAVCDDRLRALHNVQRGVVHFRTHAVTDAFAHSLTHSVTYALAHFCGAWCEGLVRVSHMGWGQWGTGIL